MTMEGQTVWIHGMTTNSSSNAIKREAEGAGFLNFCTERHFRHFSKIIGCTKKNLLHTMLESVPTMGIVQRCSSPRPMAKRHPNKL